MSSQPGLIGFDELKRKCDKIIVGDALDIALESAQDAAAKVIKEAMKAGAPVESRSTNPFSKGFGSNPKHPSGQLRESIIIAKRKDKALTGANAQQVRVGPSNQKGFYGYFLSKGWRSAGSRRVARKATGNTHSQSGSATSKKISAPYPDWADRAAEGASQQAYDAGEKAFNATLDKLLG